MSVYFIQSVHGGPIKIGTASDVFRRLRGLQSGSPVMLRLVATIPGDDEEEGAHHQMFALHQLHGEWFAPAPELVAYIASIGGSALGPFEFTPAPVAPPVEKPALVREIPAGPRNRRAVRIERYPWTPAKTFTATPPATWVQPIPLKRSR